MTRLFIVIPVYLLFVGWLARWPALEPLFSRIAQIPQRTNLLVSVMLVAVAAGILFVNSKRVTEPPPITRVLNQGAIGLAFAGVYNLFDGMANRAITLNFAIIVTSAFVVSEIVYQILLKVMSARNAAASTSPQSQMAAQPTGQTRPQTNGLRLLVTIPVYVFVLVFLPRNDDYRRLVEPMNALSPQLVLVISSIALVLAGVIVLAISSGRLRLQPIPQQVAFAGAIGLGFGAAINLFGYLTRLGLSISDLIIVPVGFMAAELAFLTLQWRLQSGPPD
ncbi:MAG: hypothetical protein AAF950_11860 [Pseudomonadota bacterium]